MHPIIQLIGGIALLLWGTYMVKTGMLRTFGLALRDILSKQLKNRFKGFFAGFCLSSLLQSSTAATLLIAGLQSEGVVTTAIGLSAIIGADLGSAFIARVLSFNISQYAPVLIILGSFFFFYKHADTRAGQFGRILLGLGFVMMALSQIIASTQPLRNSTEFLPLFEAFADMPLLAMATGGLLALGCFSSLAAVVITQGLVTAGVLPVTTGLWVVLGANVESTILAVITTLPVGYAGRRGPSVNALYRGTAIFTGALAITFMPMISEFFASIPDGAIYFHLSFNAVAAFIALLIVYPMSRLAERMLPTPNKEAAIPQAATNLFKKENFITAAFALRVAAREIAQTTMDVRNYWKECSDLIDQNPPEGQILALINKERYMRENCETITLFLSRVIKEPMGQEDAILWQNLKTINGSLKMTLSVMVHVVEVLREQKCLKNRQFSYDGTRELLTYHERVSECLQVLNRIIETSDEKERYQLVLRLREARNDALRGGLTLTQNHMYRVAQGDASAVETNALHLELQSLFNRLCGAIYGAVSNELDITDLPSHLKNK